MELDQKRALQYVEDDYENGDLHEGAIENEIASEEGYETDEEIDKRQFGIYQALPVDDAEPNWDEGEPATVEEYLRRVR